MRRDLLPYTLSRIVLSLALGGFFYLSGSSVWSAMLIAGVLIALFLWAPNSGRYSVHPEYGITALRRDERTQVINDQAARNAFVVVMLLSGAALIYCGAIGIASDALVYLKIILLAGVGVYYISDLALRRTQ